MCLKLILVHPVLVFFLLLPRITAYNSTLSSCTLPLPSNHVPFLFPRLYSYSSPSLCLAGLIVYWTLSRPQRSLWLHPKTLLASPYVTAPSFLTTRVCQNRGMEKPSHCMNVWHSVKTMCLLGGPAEILSLPKPPTATRYQRVTNLGKAEHDKADSKLVAFSTQM